MEIQEQEPESFKCDFDGCGKSFKRLVHLQRHQHSHDPSKIFTCEVCGKEFNRKDSLQRHTVLHQEEGKQSVSGKGKSACIACHAGKVRCDGNEKCSRCLKKGIDCIYPRTDEEPSISDSSAEPELVSALVFSEQNTDVGTDGPVILPSQDVPYHDINSIMNPPISASTTDSITGSTAFAQPPNVGGLLNFWMTARVEKDAITPISNPSSEEKNEISLEASKLYTDTYFECFHHKWPIVHQPTYQDDDPALLIPIRMIGAWIVGTVESKRFAVEIFDKLSDQVLLRLNRMSSHDKFQESLPYELCATALLTIVFSLHYADERQLSRAAILRNILVGVLREVGFFQPDIAWPDQKPGYFLPLRLVMESQRQRLAAYLFKADCYLSIMRSQPPLITIEDLHHQLPSTYALWNCNGLDIWEERQLIEPTARQVPLAHLIHGVAANIEMIADTPLLIEDVQLCLCAAQLDIYQLSINTAIMKEKEVDDAIQRTSLRLRLDSLKSKLNQMTSQPSQGIEFGQEHHLAYRYYYGFEVRRLATRLAEQRNHTSSLPLLQLHNPLPPPQHIPSLPPETSHTIASDQNLTEIEATCIQRIEARSQREQWATNWARSTSGRRALTHAYDILSFQQNLLNSNQVTVEIRQQDPMSHVGLCVAALVMWVFCKFYDQACDLCVASAVGVLDMTIWSTSEKEAWIEMPYICRPSIQGIQLCRCNSEFLMALFKPCLPEGWGIVEAIAPGILKR